MSFESKVVAFSTRFLSERSFELIVAPALADLQFEAEQQCLYPSAVASRLAVVRAVAGAMRNDVARHAGVVVLLTLVPACYYFVLIAVCFDFFHGATGADSVLLMIARVAAPLLVMSLAPVAVCFWPERPVQHPTE
jgi:hypothetical protein